MIEKLLNVARRDTVYRPAGWRWSPFDSAGATAVISIRGIDSYRLSLEVSEMFGVTMGTLWVLPRMGSRRRGISLAPKKNRILWRILVCPASRFLVRLQLADWAAVERQAG